MLITLGMFPAGVDAQCRFQQPERAEVFLVSLVSAFAACEPERFIAKSDIEACAPATRSGDLGTDGQNWAFDPATGEGHLQLRAVGSGDGSERGDLLIALGLGGLREGQEPAAGQGTLRLRLRLTLDHPQRGDLTLPDTAVEIPFTTTDGSATLETSLNTVLAGLEAPPGQLRQLPSCFVAEILGIDVLDEKRADMGPVGLGWYRGRY